MTNPDSSTKYLHQMINGLDLGFFVYDLEEKKFNYINLAFEQILLLEKGVEIKIESLLNKVHPEDQQHVEDTYQDLISDGNFKKLEFRLISPDKGEKWVCLSSVVLENKIISGYLEDVTAQRQYNNYIKKYGSKKNSVLHILAHDLAGPLAMIESLSGALAEELGAHDNKAIIKLVSLIQETSINSINLIKDLTSQEFLETTGVELIKRRVELVKAFTDIMVQYEKSEPEIEKTFRFSASSDKIFAEVDDTKLMQAINNLISNAIKFTPKGGVISVSLEDRDQTVFIKVEDNGIGIPSSLHEFLFDKFTKARRSGLNGESSTGLGMSIIKTIIEWHEGKIWFNSEEGRGTTFFIELPKG